MVLDSVYLAHALAYFAKLLFYYENGRTSVIYHHLGNRLWLFMIDILVNWCQTIHILINNKINKMKNCRIVIFFTNCTEKVVKFLYFYGEIEVFQNPRGNLSLGQFFWLSRI